MNFIEIDFESDEAIYRQLCRQIVFAIATQSLKNGDPLPSVRDLADQIGINMHTVNKSYAILRSEGFLVMDRRHGAVVSVDPDYAEAEGDFTRQISEALAKASARGISGARMHEILDDILKEYQS